MLSNSFQIQIFSNSCLKGYYRYKDLFQILPPKVQNELYQHDHPLVLELNYNQDIYPDRSDILWHRDVWEEARFEYIKKRSDKGMDTGDPWVQVYQDQTRRMRLPAIIQEICNLLTLFSHHRFFSYDSRQSWFIPLDKDTEKPKTKHSIWGQVGFISEYGGDIDKFTELTCEELPLIPTNEYYKRFRDTIGYSTDNQIEFSDNISIILDHYFALPALEKTAYYKSCHLYNQAIFYKNSLTSLSLVATVMAIEKLMNYKTEGSKSCKTCGAPENIETCKECGTPIYRLRSRFREFMATYSLHDQDKLYKDMYDIRSRLAHGGLLREDLFDTGFYAGEKDNEDRLRRNSLIVVHDALLHWLLKNGTEGYRGLGSGHAK